jgi:RNA polymerase sigma factor FliA
LRYVRAVDGRERPEPAGTERSPAQLVEQLVTRHLDLARRAAALVHPRVREHVSLDELIALANAGLAEAAHQYDPARGVAFASFAWYRVNGAILDGLRKAAPLPRRTWARLSALRAAHEYLENLADRERGAIQRGAQPASHATALAQVADALSAIRTIYLTSLEAMRDQGVDVAADTAAPGERLDTSRLGARLRDALTHLPDRERALMIKHYWEGKTLLEAGAELGVSKSWASRLHAQAVEKLRALLDDGTR